MDSRNSGHPMEATRFDHEWTDVNVKEMCIHVAAALCLAMALGMGAAQLLDDSRPISPAVTTSPDASSPGA